MAYIDVFQLNRTISIQYIDPFQYKKNNIHTRTRPYTSYKIQRYTKTGFQMSTIMFNYSNIRKPVITS